jgi:hypothetical protein
MITHVELAALSPALQKAVLAEYRAALIDPDRGADATGTRRTMSALASRLRAFERWFDAHCAWFLTNGMKTSRIHNQQHP